MRHAWFIAVIAPALSSCVSIPAVPSSPYERITIEFSPGPFCGPCHTLKIVVSSDGTAIWQHGYWQDRYSNRVEERFRLRMTPEKIRELQAALGPIRPAGERWLRVAARRSGNEACEVEMSDAPERRVQWESAGMHDDLWVDLGCDPEKYAQLFETIESIPLLVGLKLNFDTASWAASTRVR